MPVDAQVCSKCGRPAPGIILPPRPSIERPVIPSRTLGQSALLIGVILLGTGLAGAAGYSLLGEAGLFIGGFVGFTFMSILVPLARITYYLTRKQ
jgi:hypothetical protein